MNCEIITKRSDGVVTGKLECLATCDVVAHVVNILNDDDVSEVVVRKVSMDEARDLEAFEEIMTRAQSMSQIERMRLAYEAILGVGRVR